MAAALGNQYATKARVWSSAINRALAERTRALQREALDDLAEQLLKKCEEGDMAALKELGDRLEGKVAQTTILQGDDEGGPVEARILVEYVTVAGRVPVPEPAAR